MSELDDAPLYVRDGGAWVAKAVKVWTGTEWATGAVRVRGVDDWSLPLDPQPQPRPAMAVAVGQGGAIRITLDGLTWTAQEAPESVAELNSVRWLDGQFVAVGTLVGGGICVLTSVDGQDWPLTEPTWTTLPWHSSYIPTDIAYGGGIWVMASDSQFLAVSSDLKHWKAISGTGFSRIEGVSYGGGQFAAAGASAIGTSLNGETWVQRASNITTAIQGIVYAGETWVAVASGGQVATSPNAVTWTRRTTPSSRIRMDVAHHGGLWAVSGVGEIITSPNLVTWTARNPGTTDWVSGVDVLNGRWLAVGFGGYLGYSDDGLAWVALPNSGATLRAIAKSEEWLPPPQA